MKKKRYETYIIKNSNKNKQRLETEAPPFLPCNLLEPRTVFDPHVRICLYVSNQICNVRRFILKDIFVSH
ncbi:hypothetical protein Hanom_Chr00s002649g01702861 [Helianthus anomalus]